MTCDLVDFIDLAICVLSQILECCFDKLEKSHHIGIMVLRMQVGFGIDGFFVYLTIPFDSQDEKDVVGTLVAVDILFLLTSTVLACTSVVHNALGHRTVAAAFKLLSVSNAIGLFFYTFRSMTREEWNLFIDEEKTSFAIMIISALDLLLNILELGFHAIMWIVIFRSYRQEKEKKTNHPYWKTNI